MDIKDALYILWEAGKETLDIYFAEDISPGDESWFTDVMQDDINEIANSNWTWTVMSKKEFEKENEEGEIVDWEIIVDKPFSDMVVKDAIQNWLKERGYKFNVNLISLEEAKGSGYIKNLRERLGTNEKLKTINFADLQ